MRALCASGGWHICGWVSCRAGNGAVRVAVFLGCWCSGRWPLAMCEWWLAHSGLTGVCAGGDVPVIGCFPRLLCRGSTGGFVMCEWWLAHCAWNPVNNVTS